MGAALCIVDIVTEPKHILMELIHILERRLYFNSLCLSFKIYGIMDNFLLGI